jgi:hypothetical protein
MLMKIKKKKSLNKLNAKQNKSYYFLLNMKMKTFLELFDLFFSTMHQQIVLYIYNLIFKLNDDRYSKVAVCQLIVDLIVILLRWYMAPAIALQ